MPHDRTNWSDATPKERHRPPHLIGSGEALFLTGTTHKRAPMMQAAGRRTHFLTCLSQACAEFDVQLVAWVVLNEHYHLVIRPEDRVSFTAWIRALHRRTSTDWNREDGLAGRQVWYDYWEPLCGRRATSGAGSTTSTTTR
jgi:putative transposase